MGFIREVSVKTRLRLVLLFFILFGIVFATFSIYQIRGGASLIHQVQDHSLNVSKVVLRADLNVEKSRNLIKEIIMSEDSLIIEKDRLSIEEEIKMLEINLNTIRDNVIGDAGKELQKATRKLYQEWAELWREEWFYLSKGNIEEALKIHSNKGKVKAVELEAKLEQLEEYTSNQADKFSNDFTTSQNHNTVLLIAVFFVGTLGCAGMTTLITKSILSSIFSLKKAMNVSAKEGKLIEASVKGKNEITEMAEDYNYLVKTLIRSAWLSEGKNSFRAAISDIMKIDDFSEKVLNFIARYTNAGSAVFYLYDEHDDNLTLAGAYAYTERDFLQNVCKLGVGIVGQVAKEKNPILLKNVKKSEAVVNSGTISIQPLSIYAFPLKYNNKLLGVVEILFTNEISKRYIEFLDEAGNIISIALNNNLQNDKIRLLFDETEKSKVELQQQSEELQKVNAHLEEQQQVLSHQSEELQLANTQMEEQQQELQQMNSQLEEQKEALVKQNQSMEEKNRQMDLINRDLDARSCELEEANKYKSDLLANMSHELRTPLNSIILLSRLLSIKDDKVFDEKEVEKVQVIYKSGIELLRLIDDILDLSKIEAGKMQINETRFHSNDLAVEWKEMFKEVAAEKQLAFEMTDNIDSELFGDRNKLSQIVRNFMSNAFKFTKAGTVDVKLDRNEDRGFPYKISIMDTGIGIPQEKQQMIFDAFSQANSSITREFGGTGLGLSICKEMAKLIGAQIQMNSKEGKGSEFILLLPNNEDRVLKSDNSLKQSVIDNDQVNLLVDDRKNVRKGDKVILIIDDDVDFNKVMTGVAREHGFKVLLSVDGKTGLELARKYMPMGILLDLVLPDISGTKLLSVLKSEKGLSNIPVHIISGAEEDIALRKSGAIGFTAKPISLEDIREALNQIIRFSKNSVKHVLLVEDDEVQVAAITELLSAENIKIVKVSEEKVAVSELEKGVYDAVIVDLMLENGSGLNLCRYIDEKAKDIPVIVYTAKSLTFEQEHELKRYSDSIILKTANSHERLMDEVRMFLHKVREDKKVVRSVQDKLLEDHNKDLKGKKILIVDDDAKNVFVLAAALERLEVEVGNAHNGKEAINKLKNEKFDLVLMDIMMPVMDGYEAIKFIKGDEELKYVPIIALTAKALKGDKEKALESGADDYISKPLDYDILVRLINAWINKRADV